jgi:hypothetical protein
LFVKINSAVNRAAVGWLSDQFKNVLVVIALVSDRSVKL